MEIEKTKIIAVEGKDEINFFSALFKHLSITEIQLINFGGKDNFSNRIEQIVKLDNFENVTHFGLIRDADNNYKGAFESISNSLKKVNLPIPNGKSYFSTKGIPKIGVFIMPGINKVGMLESLCIETIKNDKEFECIEDFIDCLPAKPIKMEKSIIQIYLATKNPIVNSLGLGALKGHINFDNTKIKSLIDFILEFDKKQQT